MTDNIIQVHNLSFDYPGFRALDRVSLSLPAGSVTALVGPNGAGKTTLMRCIAALDTPLSGQVLVAGLDVHEQPREAHRLMGYLSDHYGLYAELTVAQGLSYAASSQGLPPAEVDAAVLRTARRLGLEDKLQQLAGALSLDPEARSSLAGVFRELQAEGMSLLVSSHILAELDEYSTHMLALSNGRVLEHRALADSAYAPGRAAERRLRLEFVERLEAAAAWLSGQDGVHSGQLQVDAVEIGFTGSLAAQAELVARCVAAGHALCTIAPLTENLQQSYLKSVQADRLARTGSPA